MDAKDAKLDAVFYTLIEIYEVLHLLFPQVTGNLDMRIGELRAAFKRPKLKLGDKE